MTGDNSCLVFGWEKGQQRGQHELGSSNVQLRRKGNEIETTRRERLGVLS
jgi:hypothetical protein